MHRRSTDASPAFAGLVSEHFELVSRGDFVNGRLDGPSDAADRARPLVLLLHDAGGAVDAPALDVAAPWARAGRTVARIDLPLHGHRRSPKLSERLVNGCAALSANETLDLDTRALVEEFARQSVSDVLRTLEALGAEADIDAQRIAVVGLGLGAQVAAWATPHAPSLAAVALAGGIGRLDDGALDPSAQLADAGGESTAYVVEICASGGPAEVDRQENLLAALPRSSRRVETATATPGVFSDGMVEAIGAMLDERGL